MKNRIFKKIISFAAAAVLTLAFAAPDARVFAAAYSKFSGSLTSSDVKDLSGIRVEVYKSVLVYENDDFQKYRNDYRFSARTDKSGAFSFDRPDGIFVIKADLSTLPEKTGLTENMWTVAGGSKAAVSAQVKKIDDIEINCRNAVSGDIGVRLFAADKTEIFCAYESEVEITGTSETADESTGRRTFTTERTITVNANGVIKKQIVASETTETVTAPVSLQKPEYDNPGSYTTDGGFFEIHYDIYQYSARTVKNVYDTLTDAKAFFDKSGFKPPVLESGCDKYNIYLVTSGVASGTTRHIKNGSSYTVLQTPLNYERGTHIFITGIIAHELFHAIMNGYTRACGVVPSKWFREAFANWAGVSFVGYTSETPIKYVNIFQSEPELPLTDTFDSRIYGALIFPEMIYENYGGMAAIKRIMEEFRHVSGDSAYPEFEAMDRALSKTKKKMSFKKAFVRFSLMNMFPSAYYSMSGSASWNDAKRSAGTITGGCTLRDLECLPLSARYYDVSAHDGGKSLYLTVDDRSGSYSGISVCCVITRGSGSRGYFTDSPSSFCTYRIRNFSEQGNPEISFGLVNTAIDAKQYADLKITYAK